MKKICIALFFSFFLLQLNFSQNCPPVDLPDMLFQDVNDDGIDGDITHAIFVAVLGNDTNPGTMLLPVQTIEKGILLASAAGKNVYVSRGTYVLTSSLQIASGVSLYGMFNSADNWSRSASDTTIISGVQTAVLAANISNETHIEGFEIRSANATNAGESSYAVRIYGGGAKTILRFNTLKPGAAGNGTTGTNGNAGQNGSAGSNGGGGSCDGSGYGIGGTGGFSSCGQTGGYGGSGGMEGDNPGTNGGVGIFGTLGGNAGGGGDPGSSGQNGSNGSNGNNGVNGTAANLWGTVSITALYTPSAGNSGTTGSNGNGGGGGGGGGGQGCTFCDNGSGNGGGGGGGGGCAGTQGTGGTSGGGSFGVFINNAMAVVDRNYIITSAGGNGGNGGNGGTGGVGGLGGAGGTSCTSEVGAGGTGGIGGAGGASGSGSGGAGGPSIGIFVNGISTVHADTNYFTLGQGGTGGQGGTNNILNNAPAGPTGISTGVNGSTSMIPILVPALCINDVTLMEPAFGTSDAIFKVSLSSPAQQTITVNYSTVNGSAQAGSDFNAISGILTFLKDEIMKSLIVTVLSDNIFGENTENFTLNLSGAVNASLNDSIGLCTITDLQVGIDEQSNSIPDSYELLQNSPNPFSGETDIAFALPLAKKVSIKVYNLSGQLISTLVNEKREAGWHHVKFDCKDLPAGIYIYRLNTDDALLIKKLSVIK